MKASDVPQSNLELVAVDDVGVLLNAHSDVAVDLHFDGRRIVSFWSLRDTEAHEGSRLFAWPRALRPFLNGTAELTLVDHVSGAESSSLGVTLGTGTDPIRVEDAEGTPLGLDKSMRVSRLFDSRSPEHLEPLLDSIGTVIDALERAGLEPFLAYGTLLGAVRDGNFIGHDSDADIGYVSACASPFDAIRESFRIQRALEAMGLRINRYSGLAFKVSVREGDGAVRGLDVFGGFMLDGQLYLMGEVGAPFRSEWLLPRSTATLAGREFPIPREPEHLLVAMYGSSWRVPDPAYKFETPLSTRRRLNAWFRGTRVGVDQQWGEFKQTPTMGTSGEASDFVRWIRAQEPAAQTFIDVGCGAASDVVWLGEQGVSSWGLDHFPRSFQSADKIVREAGLPVRLEYLGLNDLRSVMVTGAILAREPGPRVVFSRHVMDRVNRDARENMLRLAKMATRQGRFYVEARLGARERLLELVTASGGTAVEVSEFVNAEYGRWVITWQRNQ